MRVFILCQLSYPVNVSQVVDATPTYNCQLSAFPQTAWQSDWPALWMGFQRRVPNFSKNAQMQVCRASGQGRVLLAPGSANPGKSGSGAGWLELDLKVQPFPGAGSWKSQELPKKNGGPERPAEIRHTALPTTCWLQTLRRVTTKSLEVQARGLSS